MLTYILLAALLGGAALAQPSSGAVKSRDLPAPESGAAKTSPAQASPAAYPAAPAAVRSRQSAPAERPAPAARPAPPPTTTQPAGQVISENQAQDQGVTRPTKSGQRSDKPVAAFWIIVPAK